jgi:hypothetical protein
MPFAEYVARRSLAPAHIAETPYTLVLPSLTRCDTSRDRKAYRKVSLSGVPETGFYYAKRIWTVQTEPVPLDEARLLIEFLESVDDGQSFTFDPYGYPEARSADCFVVVSDDQGYTKDRLIRRGQGGADDYFQFSFGVREL